MQTLLVSKKDGIGRIQFHRPEVRNAVNLQMMTELEQVIAEWERDPELKVIVFSGDERVFVSGGDVREFHQRETKEEIYPIMSRMGRLLERIDQLDCLTIAAVEGIAVGGGCEIVTSCDLCLASEKAQFGFIQVHLHITTGWGGAGRLFRKLGAGQALSLLLTGERISAREAYELQLVDRLYPADRFNEEVEMFVKQVASVPGKVIQTYKQIAKMGRNYPSTYQMEAESCSELWESPEHRQQVEAFLKRTGRSS
ncbi:enoyl-CoA hydratase/isomerase family protein [Thermoflavimicrobium dichotomicum]|uniref:Ethylmalonyl-CoA decarboxylase n=1 Tax=Thermoflavimicrobium dichotomicum TaxID=46223 RepID=A0A1I3N825_9BACL|nr:enoyl-CoA hydratase/isomerase family protein [Thermoflavimicrobium dichotomicum]SFJ05245.1 Enoyl-CoA hydratase/carnithine racemase [Thermoflavimicrobium dichotomicum]